MSRPKTVDLELYYQLPDPVLRECFRQIYENTRNLQAQLDQLVQDVQSASSLTELQNKVLTYD